MQNLVSLENKTVIVTGAAQGIGQAAARPVLELGENVVAIDLNLNPILELAAARQMGGYCGARQVPGVELALAHGNGGVLSSQATLVLGSADTV